MYMRGYSEGVVSLSRRISHGLMATLRRCGSSKIARRASVSCWRRPIRNQYTARHQSGNAGRRPSKTRAEIGAGRRGKNREAHR